MYPDDIIGAVICEAITSNVEFKIKNEDKLGYLTAEGILQEGDELNRNRRYYPTDELGRSVMSPRTQELVTTGNLKGEAGHPIDTSLARQAKIDPTLEQVWYKKLWMDGNFVKGWFTGTSNELGKSFNEDLRRGQLPSFSLRAVGSLVNENGRMTVRKMQMITYDRVHFPSHSKAYTSKIITTEAAVGFDTKPQKVYSIDENDYFYAKAKEINAIAESGNAVDADFEIVTPLTKSEMRNYIANESARVGQLVNTFDILYESMELNPNMKTVTAKNTIGDTFSVYLEDAVQKEIMHGVADMF